MTDNEIIKALECCYLASCCDGCPQRGKRECLETASIEALNLINRQKAEIERLRGPSRAYPFCNLLGGCLVFSKSLKDYNDMRKGIESEARKEFADEFLEKLNQENDLYVRCAKNLLSEDFQRGYEEKNDDVVKIVRHLLKEVETDEE